MNSLDKIHLVKTASAQISKSEKNIILLENEISKEKILMSNAQAEIEKYLTADEIQHAYAYIKAEVELHKSFGHAEVYASLPDTHDQNANHVAIKQNVEKPQEVAIAIPAVVSPPVAQTPAAATPLAALTESFPHIKPTPILLETLVPIDPPKSLPIVDITAGTETKEEHRLRLDKSYIQASYNKGYQQFHAGLPMKAPYGTNTMRNNAYIMGYEEAQEAKANGKEISKLSEKSADDQKKIEKILAGFQGNSNDKPSDEVKSEKTVTNDKDPHQIATDEHGRNAFEIPNALAVKNEEDPVDVIYSDDDRHPELDGELEDDTNENSPSGIAVVKTEVTSEVSETETPVTEETETPVFEETETPVFEETQETKEIQEAEENQEPELTAVSEESSLLVQTEVITETPANENETPSEETPVFQVSEVITETPVEPEEKTFEEQPAVENDSDSEPIDFDKIIATVSSDTNNDDDGGVPSFLRNK